MKKEAWETPSIELHLKVRAAFVTQGTSLQKICDNNGIHRPHAKHALRGSWNGPKGQAVRKKLCDLAGVK